MKKSLLFIAFGLLLFSCKKEQSNQYVIDPVHVSQNGNKSNLKSDLQFVSIAYSDLFGQQISSQELTTLIATYNSVGDKALIIDLMLRNMLLKPGIIKAAKSEMQNDPETFITESFNRFLIREPSEMELWFFADILQKNAQLNPEDFYYALMSAEEYRYY